MSNSQFLKESYEILDNFNETFKISIKKQNLKFKKKVISEKSKLLKSICDEYNLDFDNEFDKHIGCKYNKKLNKKLKKKDDQIENNSVNQQDEKILSKIEIDKSIYWIDDDNKTLYDSKNFKKIGSYKDGKLCISNC